MSSHREAPQISQDPVADSTDLYAFVSPDQPDTVTLIANYLPLQEPAGGPNFYEFGHANPMLASLLNDLYPGVFPNLAALASSGAPRADLEAILLTGIPAGLISGFENYTGSTQADMLRLNTSIPPSSSPNIQGVIGGDLAGYPNGRRVFDDVVSISLRAVAGMIYYLVDSSYVPDAAANVITDGLTPSSLSMPFFPEFPYLGTAYSGFENPS
jgi:hypothetical protein